MIKTDPNWSAIERILEAKAYAERNWLNGGAARQELGFIEEAFGRKFPRSLRDMLLAHDGGRGPGLIYGYWFFDSEEMFKAWKTYRAISPAADMIKRLSSSPAGCIKLVDRNPHWIPFAGNMYGDHVGLDFDPGIGGTAGQVIHFGRRVDAMKVLAPSFDEFLVVLLEDLEEAVLIDGRLEWPRRPFEAS